MISENSTKLHGSSKHSSDVGKVSSGSYVGNDSANRAIPHGLGRVPKFVGIWAPTGNMFLKILDCDRIVTLDPGATYGVTVDDTTNFYIGTAGFFVVTANSNGVTYNWVAVS